jgi:predicted RNA-binding Zn ribbon-like protein
MVSTIAPPVPGGGRPRPLGYLFELGSGRLCLDFANTVDSRPTGSPRELLPTYAELLDWSRQSGILTREEERGLRSRAERRGAEASRALTRARRLRESLFQLFSGPAAGRRQSPPRTLLACLTTAFRTPVLRGHRLLWEDDRTRLDFVIGPVVRSAVELWTSTEIDRVRVCAAEECAWLFLDESRNRSRQWCDMTVCGNRAKARRFYLRARSGARAEGGRRRR